MVSIGAWRVARNNPRKVISEHGLTIGRALLHKDGTAAWSEADAEAHARLMAAAPELLSIAQRCVAIEGGAWDVQRHAADKRELIEAARAVVAKAEGRDPF